MCLTVDVCQRVYLYVHVCFCVCVGGVYVGVCMLGGLEPMSTERKIHRNGFFIPSQTYFCFRLCGFVNPFIRVCDSVYASFDKWYDMKMRVH